MVPIGTGLLSGERVVFEMSLGRKNSMYRRSFKGAPGTQFRGFHAAAQLHCFFKASNFGRPWLSCHVSFSTCHPTLDTSKNVKFRLSRNLTKFDKVIRFREMNSTVKSVSSFEI